MWKIKNIVWNLLQSTNQILFSIPIHFIRKLYIELFITAGKSNYYGQFIRFYGGGRIKLGNDIHINRNVMLDGRKGLIIGDSVDVGEYVSIWSLQHNPNSETHDVEGETTVIEDHVWIAPHAIILPGVVIHRGAVVATGSIVTKDVPSMAIVAGIPAKKIGLRNNSLTYQLH